MIFLTSCLYIILQDMLVNINICYSDMHFFQRNCFFKIVIFVIILLKSEKSNYTY